MAGELSIKFIAFSDSFMANKNLFSLLSLQKLKKEEVLLYVSH